MQKLLKLLEANEAVHADAVKREQKLRQEAEAEEARRKACAAALTAVSKAVGRALRDKLMRLDFKSRFDPNSDGFGVVSWSRLLFYGRITITTPECGSSMRVRFIYPRRTHDGLSTRSLYDFDAAAGCLFIANGIGLSCRHEIDLKWVKDSAANTFAEKHSDIILDAAAYLSDEAATKDKINRAKADSYSIDY